MIMILEMENDFDGHITTIRLSGQLRSEYLEELKAQIKNSVSKVVLNLDDVSLVDAEVVRFLGHCQAEGVTLLNCSPYIRNWIAREQA
jgi:ABC-type transporter Mla MlaB component